MCFGAHIVHTGHGILKNLKPARTIFIFLDYNIPKIDGQCPSVTVTCPVPQSEALASFSPVQSEYQQGDDVL